MWNVACDMFEKRFAIRMLWLVKVQAGQMLYKLEIIDNMAKINI